MTQWDQMSGGERVFSVVLIIALFWFLIWGGPKIERWIKRDPSKQTERIALTVMGFGGLFGAGAFFFTEGRVFSVAAGILAGAVVTFGVCMALFGEFWKQDSSEEEEPEPKPQPAPPFVAADEPKIQAMIEEMIRQNKR